MPSDASALVPRDKFDVVRAEAAVAAGYPAVGPVLPSLLEWLQDMNWPVARVLAPFAASIGAPLESNLREILSGPDLVWKYWIISQVIAKSPELQRIFRAELHRLVEHPTEPELREELNEVAQEALHGARPA
jgi:hypothetical protein